MFFFNFIFFGVGGWGVRQKNVAYNIFEGGMGGFKKVLSLVMLNSGKKRSFEFFVESIL